MSIMWRYLDKRSATIAAIKDFNNMQFIIRDTGEEIRGVYETAAGVSSPKLDDMPKAHNPNAGEDRAIRAIEEIDLLRERYRQACEYMAWFQPAWDALSEDDRFVLDTFFCSEMARDNCPNSGTIYEQNPCIMIAWKIWKAPQAHRLWGFLSLQKE